MVWFLLAASPHSGELVWEEGGLSIGSRVDRLRFHLAQAKKRAGLGFPALHSPPSLHTGD